MLLKFKNSFTLLDKTFSNILETTVSYEIRLKLDMQDFPPFLYTGLTFNYIFKSFWRTPTAID
jgi:hypothetical protein